MNYISSCDHSVCQKYVLRLVQSSIDFNKWDSCNSITTFSSKLKVFTPKKGSRKIIKKINELFDFPLNAYAIGCDFKEKLKLHWP